MSELIKLRRRARALLVVCLILAGLATYGWVRDPTLGRGAEAAEVNLDGFRQRISRAGQAQRVRILRRLVRDRGARAVSQIIEMLHSAQTEKVRLAAIRQLGAAAAPASLQ